MFCLNSPFDLTQRPQVLRTELLLHLLLLLLLFSFLLKGQHHILFFFPAEMKLRLECNKMFRGEGELLLTILCYNEMVYH